MAFFLTDAVSSLSLSSEVHRPLSSGISLWGDGLVTQITEKEALATFKSRGGDD